MIIVIFFRGESQTEFSGNIKRIDNVDNFWHEEGKLFIEISDDAIQYEVDTISHYQVIP